MKKLKVGLYSVSDPAWPVREITAPAACWGIGLCRGREACLQMLHDEHQAKSVAVKSYLGTFTLIRQDSNYITCSAGREVEWRMKS